MIPFAEIHLALHRTVHLPKAHPLTFAPCAVLASLFLLASLAPAVTSGQELSDKRAARPGAALDALTGQAHAAIRAVSGAACTNGSATLGNPINGTLTTSDCSSTSSSGTLYADFYTFTATAGHTLTVATHSSLAYLATIQDNASGTVLASSGSCGQLEDDCSFTYLVPTSGVYLAGFGSYGLGNYTLTITDTAPPPPSCGDTTTLCLNDSGFSVTVHWATTAGAAGSGTAIPLSSDTGYFWFFNSANVELVVKVLDGRAINGHFWVFYGALSDVAYTIVVTDRATGASRTYSNPQGTLASVADTAAF